MSDIGLHAAFCVHGQGSGCRLWLQICKALPTCASSPLPVMAFHLTSPLDVCPWCPGQVPLRQCGTALPVQAVSYERGLVCLWLHSKSCSGCNRTFRGCWAMPKKESDEPPLLACDPALPAWFLFRVRPRRHGLSALSGFYLRYMTSALLHLRGSFSGFSRVMHDLFSHSGLDSQECRRALEHAWMLHETLALTYPALQGRPCDFRVDHIDALLIQMEPYLTSALDDQARQHACSRCNNPVLTGDGGMKLTTALCNERTSCFCSSPELRLQVLTGCTERPLCGSLYCRRHQAPGALGPEVQSHRFQSGQVQFKLAGSQNFHSPDSIPADRLRQYDSRGIFVACENGDSTKQEDAAAVTVQMEPTDDAAGCRCAKDERKRLAVRKYAGVFVLVLPCGHIVHVSHLVGSESLPQVALAFAEGMRLVPSKTFLCYDFACGLARFLRNPVRAESTDVLRRLAACTFVVPDSHIRNHTACVDPSNATYYMPEVKKAAHPELAGVNCEAQEQVFSWVRWLTHSANPMTPAKHRAYFKILVLRRNARRCWTRTEPRARLRPSRPGYWRGARRVGQRPSSSCLAEFQAADPASAVEHPTQAAAGVMRVTYRAHCE